MPGPWAVKKDFVYLEVGLQWLLCYNKIKSVLHLCYAAVNIRLQNRTRKDAILF